MTASKERPILFSGEMVRAILNGRKTQTRRVIKPQPSFVGNWSIFFPPNKNGESKRLFKPFDTPYGQPGDRLWVRESGWEAPNDMRKETNTREPYYYDADEYTDIEKAQFRDWGFKRRSSIHMPRWASRIILVIKSVRVERLHDITDRDARAEGVRRGDYYISDRQAFFDLWRSIYGIENLRANPWVWVIKFEVAK